jgi:ABC-type Fe3+-siderophore transport system permease subunit
LKELTMSSLPEVHSPPIGLGMTSLVVGTIGLMLFFLPVLGIPISAFGLFFGVLGLLVAFFGTRAGGGARLRWTLAGIAVSCLGLAVNVAIAYAPAGYLPGREVPKSWQSPPDRPFVSPPAR